MNFYENLGSDHALRGQSRLQVDDLEANLTLASENTSYVVRELAPEIHNSF